MRDRACLASRRVFELTLKGLKSFETVVRFGNISKMKLRKFEEIVLRADTAVMIDVKLNPRENARVLGKNELQVPCEGRRLNKLSFAPIHRII